MRVGVVALVHADPMMLRELSQALGEVPLFVHVDRLALRRGLLSHLVLPSTVHVNPDSRCVHWGGFSVLQATLETIEWALSKPESRNLDTIVCLSGSCYPVRPFPEFVDYLQRTPPVHARAFDLTKGTRPTMSTQRLTQRHFLDGTFGHAKKTLGSFGVAARLAARTLGLPFKVNVPSQFNACGSQWMALPKDLCKDLVSAFRSGMFDGLRQAFAPDEIAIQSYIYNTSWVTETQLGSLESATGVSVADYPNFHWLRSDMSGYVSKQNAVEARAAGFYFIRKVRSADVPAIRDAIENR